MKTEYVYFIVWAVSTIISLWGLYPAMREAYKKDDNIGSMIGALSLIPIFNTSYAALTITLKIIDRINKS